MDAHLDPRLRSDPPSLTSTSTKSTTTDTTTNPSPFPPLPNAALSENPVRLPPPTRTQLPPLSSGASQLPYYHAPLNSSNVSPPPRGTGPAAETDGSVDPKRPRACEACRGLKVRCEFNPSDLDGPCKRCAKAGRSCVVTAPTRKRQRKTDSKVAELERKIDLLTASIQASRSQVGRQDESQGSSGHGQNAADVGADGSFSGGVADPWRGGEGVASPGMEAVRRTSWLRQAEVPPVIGPPQPPSSKEPAPGLTAFSGLKRKHSDDSPMATSTSPNIRMTSAPLPRPSAERSSPGKEVPTTMYQFLIPKPVAPRMSSTPSATPSDSTTGMKANVDLPPRYEYADVIDRQMLSSELAISFFDRYVNVMAPQFPAVIFPPGTKAAEIRKTKPTLFLAILSVGSGTSHPDVQKVLTKEIMRVLADRVIYNGEKTVEIIQALHVVTIWYWPPEYYDELKFYQLIHIAALMAIDLGMGKRSKSHKAKHAGHAGQGFMREYPWRRSPLPNPESAESRRTWLTCYFLCACVSMSLRRPNLLRWTAYMGECVAFLESSAEALESDRKICRWVRVQHIADEVGEKLSMDDPCASVSLSDDTVRSALKGFENQLKDWYTQLPKELDDSTTQLNGHTVNLYMHEIAMHVDHNVDDFKPPFNEDDLKPSRNPELLNPTHLTGLSTCLSAIQSIIGIFLTYDTETVRVQPIFQFVRVAYAVVCLTKLYFTVTSPNSEMGKVINLEDLKVEHNLDGLLETFRTAAEGDRCRPASKFLMILVMLKSWYQKQKCGGGFNKDASASGRMTTNNHAGGQHTEECCPIRRAYSELVRDRSQTETPKSVGGVGYLPTPNFSQADEPMRAAESSNRSTAHQRGETLPSLSGYSTANTPLQLLSEVAMGDSNALVDAQAQAAAAHIGGRLSNGGRSTPASSSAASWYGFPAAAAAGPQAPSMDYSNPAAGELNSAPNGVSAGGGLSDAEMDAIMGGGFGQALGMTLGDEDFPSLLLDDMFFSRLGDASSQNSFEQWG
ncbi:MAG: hypothetical protein M1816_007415 [Peltula sp. TS41687]|nr:MAG: hypothetical protein M1816_007415 [Peltula sp. TS41687]